MRSSGPVFRIITWLLGALLLLAIIAIVAMQFGDVEAREDRTVADLLSQWRGAGLSVGPPGDLPDKQGAVVAVQAEVDDDPVNIYQFDPDDPAQFRRLEQIRADHALVEQGKKTPALVNGPFVLTDFGGHKNQEILVKTFQGFGTFEGIQTDVKLDTARPPSP